MTATRGEHTLIIGTPGERRDDMTDTYICTDGGAEIEIEADSPLEAAREYVGDGGAWNIEYETLRVYVSVYPAGNPDDSDYIRVEIDPGEPDCDHADGHDWIEPHALLGGCEENPGTFGHGGGVRSYDLCGRCGLGRCVDTAATDMCGQTYEQLTYTPGEYTDRLGDLDR